MHAFVFPGQGSQSVGMLQDLSVRFHVVREIFDRVSYCLGEDFWDLIEEGPVSKLNQTEYTQVAMLAADIAVYTVLRQQGVAQASVMAGHSLGEYAALVAADAISLENAALLVRTRGQLMQQTVPMGMGAMAAIVGLTDEQVLNICLEASTSDSKVTPANYNAIGQVVIAGHTAAVNSAILLADAMDARLAKIIPVSVPSHCMLLEEAANLFAEALNETIFTAPSVPVISNVDLTQYTNVADIRRLLQQQLYKPVRWVETILQIKQTGIVNIVECGPGKVLSGLIKRIDKTLQPISGCDDLDKVLGMLT